MKVQVEPQMSRNQVKSQTSVNKSIGAFALQPCCHVYLSIILYSP